MDAFGAGIGRRTTLASSPLDLPAVLVRGGTSKCWIFDDLLVESLAIDRDLLLENAFGSGDSRQIDGIGGATSTTSKAALVRPSTEAGIDVDYLFAQVGIADRVVEWGSNCGNCASAVGLYAVQQGLVRITGERTVVRLRNTNTGTIVDTTVATVGGIAGNTGEATVPGVDFPGVSVDLTFLAPFAQGGALVFPTGSPLDHVAIDATPAAEVTVIDAGAKALLIDAAALGMTANETLDEFRAAVPLLTRFRARGAVIHGIIAEGEPAPSAVPKTGIIGPPRDYVTADGTFVSANEFDLGARLLSMGAPHPAIGLTSAVALAVAAATPGTIVNRFARPGVHELRVGTLSGIVEVAWFTSADGAVSGVTLHRAARRLATATLHIGTDREPRRFAHSRDRGTSRVAEQAMA